MHIETLDDTLQGRIRFAVIGPQVRERAGQDGHWVSVVPKSAEEPSCIRVHHAVVEHFAFKVGELHASREEAIDEEVCTLEERGLGSELFDGIASAGVTLVGKWRAMGVRRACNVECRCRRRCK